jgi:hypothetical protein
MQQRRRFPALTIAVLLSGPCFAAGQAQTGPEPAASPAPQGQAKVCLDVQSSDELIGNFADRLKETIAGSGALTLAAANDSCNLRLHIPGNLLRFQTAGRVMVSTVVIVTSPEDRYLSTSIAACQANDLEPCAVRAVAAAKLALLMASDGGSPADGR